MVIALLVYFLLMFNVPQWLTIRKYIAGLELKRMEAEIAMLKTQIPTKATTVAELVKSNGEMRVR